MEKTTEERNYIVPMHKVIDNQCVEFKVIIPAKNSYLAWCIAFSTFERDGWKVFPRYGEYEEIKM